MINFAAYAAGFELFPKTGDAFVHLSPLISHLIRVDFSLTVNDPTTNQGQMSSDFDKKFEESLRMLGAVSSTFMMPSEAAQELDFTFRYQGKNIAVEIEKTNREKILRDILKCHIYLHAGADFTVIVLPANYPHKLGMWNLFEFGVQRLSECETYGFGTPDKLNRILLLGFKQYDAKTGEALSTMSRKWMRNEAAK
ncbi:MAG TPA: hypothetical protein VG754_05595 [Verrucomicrobiae bacterium]|nr:hypothetical protein [Verrucomicrobiae bacterium]